MDWRLHYLLVRTAVMRDVLEKLRALVADRRQAGDARCGLTAEEAANLSCNVARVVKELSVGDRRCGVVNIYFKYCDFEAENRVVPDSNQEV